MTVFLDPGQVERIHDRQSAQPLRDRAALSGAVMRCQAGWADELLYPDLFHQAAILLMSISQAQAFVDGNKRTAWVAFDVFLTLNRCHLTDLVDDEILDLMNAISLHAIGDLALAAWARTHTEAANP